MSKATIEEDSDIVVKRRPGGLICRLEPDNTQWILQFPRSAQLMRDAGWFYFFEKLQGYHTQVTMAFIKKLQRWNGLAQEFNDHGE